ncbi:DUF3265 domain-containing protein [Photobacterium damselae]|nr:DUF3265 domain-containing protein [Photobacterium damselae]
MRNAWHFYYALRLVFQVVCGSIRENFLKRFCPTMS